MQLPFGIVVNEQGLTGSGYESGSGGSGSGSEPHSQYCDQLSQSKLRLEYSLIAIAAVILIILSFMYHRVRICKRLLWGVPGLAVPVNLLSPTRFRSVYSFIFGAMSSSLLHLVFHDNDFTISTDIAYLDIFFKTILSPAVAILVVLLIYFPIFACVETPVPLMGHIIGLLYTCILVAREVMRKVGVYVGCNGISYQAEFTAIAAVGTLPVYVCYLIILVWYIHRITLDIVEIYKAMTAVGHFEQEKLAVDTGLDGHRHRQSPPWDHFTLRVSTPTDTPLHRRIAEKEYGTSNGPTTDSNGVWTVWIQRSSDGYGVRHAKHKQETRYYLKYVSSLLNRSAGHRESLIGRFMSQVCHIFSPNKGLRLPLKFLGVLTVMLIVLYQLSFESFTLAATLGSRGVNEWKNSGLALINRILNTNQNVNIYKEVLNVLNGLTAVFALASVLSFVVCLFLILHMVFSVHKQLRIAVKGKLHTLSRSNYPSFQLASSLKYAGFQIGFFVLAWLMYWSLTALVGIAGIVLYYLYKYFPTTALYYTVYVVFPAVFSLVIYYSQVLLCKLVFIRKGGGKFISISNRRLWNWFEYVFLFYNTIVGFVAAIFRVVVSSLFSLLLLFRLDTVILMKGFEFGDTGHRAYIGFLYLEYTYNNPVVNMFVKLLTDAVSTQGRSMARHVQEEVEEESVFPKQNDPLMSVHYSFKRKQQARNRWLVAYTLLRNPSLQELTASTIEERRVQKMIAMNSEGREREEVSHWLPTSRTDDRERLVFTDGSNL